jgi:opacity protein-like surface antigen
MAALTVALWSAFAQAATIRLKDGSIIKGTIVSATAQDIQVNSDGGLLKIKSDRILRVDYSDDASQPQLPQVPTAPAQPSAASTPPPVPVQNDTMDYEPRRVRRARVVRYEPDDTSYNQIFSLNFGLAVPLSRVDFGSAGGGSDDNGDSGLLLGAQYLYQSTPRWAWGFDLEYMNRGLVNSGSALPFADTNISGDSLLLLPVFKYSLINRGDVRPYLLAGIGLNRTSTLIEAQPQPGFVWDDTNSDETRTLVNDSNWGLAETARIGIDFMAFSPSFFSLEFGWTGISNGHYNATQAGQDLGLSSVTGNLSVLNISGRWGWRF